YLREVRLADSTRAMKASVIEREIAPVLGRLTLEEISTQRLRALCEKIRDRGGRATALQVREIVGAVFDYAIDRGYEI
ncbi:integrase, partial [Klebsiella pneumoniae]|nr:integrase [Klebsiella pneumoniae]